MWVCPLSTRDSLPPLVGDAGGKEKRRLAFLSSVVAALGRLAICWAAGRVLDRPGVAVHRLREGEGGRKLWAARRIAGVWMMSSVA